MDTWERNVSYGLITVLFGLATIAIVLIGVGDILTLSGPSTALFLGGALGLVTGMKRVNGGGMAKPYDILFGIVFGLIGVFALAAELAIIQFIPQQVQEVLGPQGFGLYLGYSPIFAFLGLFAVIRGVQRAAK